MSSSTPRAFVVPARASSRLRVEASSAASGGEDGATGDRRGADEGEVDLCLRAACPLQPNADADAVPWAGEPPFVAALSGRTYAVRCHRCWRSLGEGGGGGGGSGPPGATATSSAGGGDAANLRCGRCRRAHYCSRDCQREAWRAPPGAGGHRLECALLCSFAERQVAGAAQAGAGAAVDVYGSAHVVLALRLLLRLAAVAGAVAAAPDAPAEAAAATAAAATPPPDVGDADATRRWLGAAAHALTALRRAKPPPATAPDAAVAWHNFAALRSAPHRRRGAPAPADAAAAAALRTDVGKQARLAVIILSALGVGPATPADLPTAAAAATDIGDGLLYDDDDDDDDGADDGADAPAGAAEAGEEAEARLLRRLVYELLCVVAANAHTVYDDELRPAGAALFPLLSTANHACAPAACVAYAWQAGGPPLARLRVTRALAAGDALTLCYVDAAAVRRVRQGQLRRQYGFDCRCARCGDAGAADSDEGDDVWHNGLRCLLPGCADGVVPCPLLPGVDGSGGGGEPDAGGVGGDAGDDEDAAVEAALAAGDDGPPRPLCCLCCGGVQPRTLADVGAQLRALDERVRAADKQHRRAAQLSLASGQQAPAAAAERSSLLQTARQAYIACLGGYARLLHRRHLTLLAVRGRLLMAAVDARLWPEAEVAAALSLRLSAADSADVDAWRSAARAAATQAPGEGEGQGDGAAAVDLLRRARSLGRAGEVDWADAFGIPEPLPGSCRRLAAEVAAPGERAALRAGCRCSAHAGPGDAHRRRFATLDDALPPPAPLPGLQLFMLGKLLWARDSADPRRVAAVLQTALRTLGLTHGEAAPLVADLRALLRLVAAASRQ